MTEPMNIAHFSQLVFKAAYEVLVPEIFKMKENETKEEEFQLNLLKITESMAEAIINGMSKDDIKTILPDIYSGMSLPFLTNEKEFNSFIKKDKRDAFKKRVIHAFTITSLLIAINKIFEWGEAPEGEDSTDSISKEPEESVIPE